jgi:hypothetical protein
LFLCDYTTYLCIYHMFLVTTPPLFAYVPCDYACSFVTTPPISAYVPCDCVCTLVTALVPLWLHHLFLQNVFLVTACVPLWLHLFLCDYTTYFCRCSLWLHMYPCDCTCSFVTVPLNSAYDWFLWLLTGTVRDSPGRKLGNCIFIVLLL